jgi:tetratricopeptide (TPR) repeat protein
MNGPHTQLFLTHIDENGNDSPPILLENLIIDGKAANIPEFVNIKPETRMEIEPSFLDGKAFMLRMAQINNKKNDIEVALLQFNAILNENPKNADALVGRADILMKKKQTEKALADFSLAISIKPRMASYYIARGSAYGDIGQPSKAIDDFSKAIDLDAYSFMAYNNRGLIKFRQGKTDEAILDYTKSLELNDQAYMTMVNLGAALAKSKDLNQARTYFERAIKLQPDQTLAYVALATLMNQIGNTDESLKSINRALEIEPNKVDALNLRAVVLEKSMDYANALVDYTKILSLDNSIDAFRNAMRLCSLQNDYKTMINVTETLLQKTTPFTAEVLYYQGVAYYNLNKMDEACQAMTKSANLGYIKAKEELKRFCGKVG